MKDLYSNVKVEVALNAAITTATTDTAGSAIDLQGYNSAVLVAQTGVVTTTNASIDLRVQESDTSTASDFTDVADDDLLGTESAFSFDGTSASIANSVRKIGYIGNKRYIRPVRTAAASATGIVGVAAVLGHPADGPVA